MGGTTDSLALVFGVARKFSRTFAGVLKKILSRYWRGPHVSEGFSRAHDWLLALKTGEPTRSSGPLAGVAPESGASNRAAHVLNHAEHGHPKAVCGEKAPVPSTTCYLAGGLPAPQATDLCRTHVALSALVLLRRSLPMSQRTQAPALAACGY